MNYKVKVNNEAESKEVQELFFGLSYKWFSGGNQVQHLKQSCSSSFGYLVAWSSGCFTDVIQCGCGNEDAKEITLPELRDLVVLKRDNVKQAKHNHYYIDVSNVDEVDFYEIALRYNVTDPCIQHILKKCLAVGGRGHKDFRTDLKDIYDTAKRALDIHKVDQ